MFGRPDVDHDREAAIEHMGGRGALAFGEVTFGEVRSGDGRSVMRYRIAATDLGLAVYIDRSRYGTAIRSVEPAKHVRNLDRCADYIARADRLNAWYQERLRAERPEVRPPDRAKTFWGIYGWRSIAAIVNHAAPSPIVCERCLADLDPAVVYFAVHEGYPFCGECAREAPGGYRWRHRWEVERTCRCGRLMVLTGNTIRSRRYCGYRCWYAAKLEERRRARARARVDRECDWCGETFAPKRSDARTCSDRCRQALSRSRRQAVTDEVLSTQVTTTPTVTVTDVDAFEPSTLHRAVTVTDEVTTTKVVATPAVTVTDAVVSTQVFSTPAVTGGGGA